MRRSTAPRSTLASIALLSATVLASGCTGPMELEPPAPACPGCNVVLISMDTLRADHVGA